MKLYSPPNNPNFQDLLKVCIPEQDNFLINFGRNRKCNYLPPVSVRKKQICIHYNIGKDNN